MTDEMGTVRFPADALDALSVDRLKELHFRQADGSILTRWTGPAIIYAEGTLATDDVVFGEPGDLVLLGARTLAPTSNASRASRSETSSRYLASTYASRDWPLMTVATYASRSAQIT
jgi:hypothetical protein